MPTIEAVQLFADNYAWLGHEARGGAFVVDPGAAEPVLARLEAVRLNLHSILLTHHHDDHIGGALQLAAATGACIYGPDDARIPAQRRVGDGDRFPLGAAECQVLTVPGHTQSHVAFLWREALFSGDTLFSIGCGRLFEGRPEQMWNSLCRLRALPSHLRVYCGHEYTLNNLRFARWLLPEDAALTAYQVECEAQRASGRPTVPSMLAHECALNPFLRADRPAVMAAVRRIAGAPIADPAECFARLRALKDGFR